MKLHLSYDGKQDNGIIFNDKYTNGSLYVGAEFKPKFSFEYYYMQMSEVFDEPNYVVDKEGIKRLMTDKEVVEVKTMATTWVQPLGQEGNPNPEQIQEAANQKARTYLTETDWYILRNLETGKEVPTEISQKRANARDAIIHVSAQTKEAL